MERISGSIASCHVVAIPWPGRGHVNPMMNLCKLLAAKADIIITFVVTEEWLSFIGSAPKPPNIRFQSIPNVIPSELVRAADFTGFVEAVFTMMEAPVEQLMDRLDLPVTAIIADTYLAWAVAVGNRRNIPVVSLWTMAPSAFSIFYHSVLITGNRHFPVVLSECGNEVVDYIPGVSSIHISDLPTVFYGASEKVFDRVLEAISWVRKAQCLMFTSFYELETKVTDTLRAILPFPVYSVGPLIPHATLGDKPVTTTFHNDMDYLKWLDSCPESSVLYVSLGSFLSVSKEQMDEIVAGVRASGVRYLWIARGDTTYIQESCGGMGLVVPWCDQLRVLCHSSVGAFWTHCGWNSTLEGVFAGVPMLTFPIFFDQIPNRKLIVDDWKVGVKVKEVGAEIVVKRKEIARIVQRLMNLDGVESKEMRRRASELQEKCRQALAKGGSSETNLNEFVREFLKCHC